LREFGLTRDLLYIHKQRVSGKKKTFKYLYFAPTTEFSTPPQFLVNDFIDPDGFINSLKDEQAPLAKYLFDNLPQKRKVQSRAIHKQDHHPMSSWHSWRVV